jgi:ABC-2 type transport system permease protein
MPIRLMEQEGRMKGDDRKTAVHPAAPETRRSEVAFWIMRRELGSLFTSPIGYIVIALFLVITGFLFFPTFFLYNQAELRGFFQLLPILFGFFVPAVTMRAFAEERRSGTIETLLTMPVMSVDAVIGKFLASTVFIAAMLAPTLLYLATASLVGKPDIGPVIGGYVGALLLGGAYSAVGVFASSLTKNQIIAFISAFMICMALSLVDQFLVILPVRILGFLEYLSAGYHFRNIAKGIIDSRDIVYFISVSLIFILASAKVIEERR